MDINNIDGFVILEDGIDINTIYELEISVDINNGIENNNNIITSDIDIINVPLPSSSEADEIDNNIIINTISETQINANINNAFENSNNNIIISDIDINVPSEDLIVGVSSKKKRKIDVRLNEKQKRAIGESYKKMKKDNSFEVVKKKKMKENVCKTKCKKECAAISETERLAIFNKYWYELNDYNRKRDYLLSCMEKSPIKRTYVLHETNRSYTFRYFLSVDNVEKEVCRKFILSTLDISEKLLR
ncbi:unnamed protein product [Macrosiphum euphorbiae]|uniref:Uncharacterized protein n=1 Tax=Macrosiphum euphorbiae TaxID=13131 RepID=A0AAV0WFC3_9HEMI|nr:unnamed protein product [Macrosiphum euphorbiae]